MNDADKRDKQLLTEAYAVLLGTPEGRRVLSDLIARLSVTVPVYAFGGHNELSDISYRDGQRNAGIYVYNQMALANPAITAQIHAEVMAQENLKIEQQEREGDESV